mmetsp:Transcript_18650/g.46562  ORF Transcript_18650/g.46562 Transcript_18650/m.46562 type:complete len:398 (-) Transcript_18650:350-1543(-)
MLAGGDDDGASVPLASDQHREVGPRVSFSSAPAESSTAAENVSNRPGSQSPGLQGEDEGTAATAAAQARHHLLVCKVLVALLPLCMLAKAAAGIPGLLLSDAFAFGAGCCAFFSKAAGREGAAGAGDNTNSNSNAINPTTGGRGQDAEPPPPPTSTVESLFSPRPRLTAMASACVGVLAVFALFNAFWNLLVLILLFSPSTGPSPSHRPWASFMRTSCAPEPGQDEDGGGPGTAASAPEGRPTDAADGVDGAGLVGRRFFDRDHHDKCSVATAVGDAVLVFSIVQYCLLAYCAREVEVEQDEALRTSSVLYDDDAGIDFQAGGDYRYPVRTGAFLARGPFREGARTISRPVAQPAAVVELPRRNLGVDGGPDADTQQGGFFPFSGAGHKLGGESTTQ